MRNRHRRRATDKQDNRSVHRRIALILALIVGIVIAGLAGMRRADALGVHTPGPSAVEPTHVLALVLLVGLFFAAAGLAGVFWYHLVDSQRPKRGKS